MRMGIFFMSVSLAGSWGIPYGSNIWNLYFGFGDSSADWLGGAWSADDWAGEAWWGAWGENWGEAIWTSMAETGDVGTIGNINATVGAKYIRYET